MKVLSAPGTQCPREEDPTSYIPDAGEPVGVPDTMYYRRLVNDGSLINTSSVVASPLAGEFGEGAASEADKAAPGRPVPTLSGNPKSKKEVTTDGK